MIKMMISVTTVRTNPYSLVGETVQMHKSLFIKGKRGNAVLISEEDWNSINEALILLSIPGNPFQSPPQFEKLVGDLEGADSRRTNIQHRFVYQVLEKIKVLRLRVHYE